MGHTWRSRVDIAVLPHKVGVGIAKIIFLKHSVFKLLSLNLKEKKKLRTFSKLPQEPKHRDHFIQHPNENPPTQGSPTVLDCFLFGQSSAFEHSTEGAQKSTVIYLLPDKECKENLETGQYKSLNFLTSASKQADRTVSSPGVPPPSPS